MNVDRTKLADVLHNTDWEGVVAIPSVNNRKATKPELADLNLRIKYGRGVLVGLVAGLMAVGMGFDDAWRLLLSIKPNIYPGCIPEGWPSADDYAAHDSVGN